MNASKTNLGVGNWKLEVWSDDVLLKRVGSRGGPTREIELGKNVADVAGDGLLAEPETRRDKQDNNRRRRSHDRHALIAPQRKSAPFRDC